MQGRKSRRRSPDDVEQHRAGELRAGPARLLHHRRQFRPQQGLGDRSSTASSICARWRSSTPASSSRSIRSATSCRISSRNARAPASSACSSGWRTSIRTICSAPRRSRTRSPNTAQMLLAWKSAGVHHLCRLHPRLSERHGQVDHARHRRDQARAAGRSAGVLLSHAAAGLGGSSQAAPAPARRSIRT